MITKLFNGLKLLTFILFYSTLSCVSLIIPYMFYLETGNYRYLLTYVVHFVVVSYMLGRE